MNSTYKRQKAKRDEEKTIRITLDKTTMSLDTGLQKSFSTLLTDVVNQEDREVMEGTGTVTLNYDAAELGRRYTMGGISDNFIENFDLFKIVKSEMTIEFDRDTITEVKMINKLH